MSIWTLQTTIFAYGASGKNRFVLDAVSDHGTTLLFTFTAIGTVNIYRSINGGQTWFLVFQDATSSGAMGKIVYGGSSHWFVGGASPGLMYYSTDDGQTWASNNTGYMAPGVFGGASDGSGTVIFGCDSATQVNESTVANTFNTFSTHSTPAALQIFARGGIVWDGTQFVAVANDAGAPINYAIFSAPTGFSGATGPTWTQQSSSQTNHLGAAAAGQSQSTLTYDSVLGYATVASTNSVIIGKSLSLFAGSTPIVTPTTNNLVGVWGMSGTIFVADDQGNLWYTTDGSTFTQDTPNFGASTEYAGSIVHDSVNGVYILFGTDPTVGATHGIDVVSAPGIPPGTVQLTPATATVPVNGGTQQFHGAAWDGTTLDWFVNGIYGGSAAAGYISQGGLYTAPIGVHSVPAPVTITAAMDRMPSVFATATATLAIPASPVVVYGRAATPGPSGISGGPDTSGVYGTAASPNPFATAAVFRPVMIANAQGIIPKIYMPPENTTVKA